MVDVLGMRLGRYEIRERLGIGGMAVVYLGWDTNLERRVAVKVLHDHLAAEAGFKERFGREAKVVAQLNHPNIVQIYDFDVAEVNNQPVYYMVMAHITGNSLKGVMDERHTAGKQLSPAEVANVMRGICSALSYAHKQGMVHRDVTPGNILFNNEGQAVLADFGIARILTAARLTQTGMTAGTPMYMAPEQGMGEVGDHRADIYSLGVILFEMLAGMAPYNGDSTFAIVMKHINEPIPSLVDINRGISTSVQNVVFRAMAKAPEDRYNDALELLADFEKATGGGEVTAIQSHGAGTVILPNKGGAGAATAIAQRPNSVTLPWPAVIGGLAIIVVVLVAAIVLRTPAQPNNTPPTSGGSELSAPIGAGPTKDQQFAESMTQGPLNFKDEFGPDRGELIWPITTNNAKFYENIEPGVGYHIWHNMPSTAFPVLFDEEHSYGPGYEYEADFTIRTDSQGDTATGIIFRYRPDDNGNDQYYVFGVNGQGQYSIWVRYKNKWTELRNQPVAWTNNAAINPIGKRNRLKLTDNGEQLTGYVNGVKVFDLDSAPLITSGAIGIYLATTSSQKVPNPMADVVVTFYSAQEYNAPGSAGEAATEGAATAVPTASATDTGVAVAPSAK